MRSADRNFERSADRNFDLNCRQEFGRATGLCKIDILMEIGKKEAIVFLARLDFSCNNFRVENKKKKKKKEVCKIYKVA